MFNSSSSRNSPGNETFFFVITYFRPVRGILLRFTPRPAPRVIIEVMARNRADRVAQACRLVVARCCFENVRLRRVIRPTLPLVIPNHPITAVVVVLLLLPPSPPSSPSPFCCCSSSSPSSSSSLCSTSIPRSSPPTPPLPSLIVVAVVAVIARLRRGCCTRGRGAGESARPPDTSWPRTSYTTF